MTAARAAVAAALLVSLGLGATAWTWRTGAVGGSDSACYALMAKAYAAGRLQPESPLALVAPWPDPTRVAAPGGFLPSAMRPGAAVPVCAPGYGLIAAPLAALFGVGIVHMLPAVSAAALAWTAFLLGRRLHSSWAGVAAALLVASHPVVLFQAVQPMNDIVTGAIWTGVAAAMLAARPGATGLLLGLGLLVRPNLALAAIVAVLGLGVVVARTAGARQSRARRALAAMMVATLAAVPGVAAVLVLNQSLYGSPFQSGYGDLGVLFAWSHVGQNLAHYGWTWLTTSTPLVLAALAAPWVLAPARRTEAWLVVAFAVALSVVYLAYRPFAEWWYVRFLLPAVVLSLVLAAAAAAALAERAGRLAGALVMAGLVAAASVWMLRSPEAGDAFGLARLEARFPLTSKVVSARLPPSSVLVTSWQSGAVRFDPGHEVVMWDALDPAWLDRAIAWLDAGGRAPAIVLEFWEQEPFRARFAGQAYGALDWPPRYDVDRRVQIFVPADRARYLRGESTVTERVVVSRSGLAR